MANTDKAEKIVALLSSDQPGEVYAAAQAIGRLLPGLNMDWHDFAKAVGRVLRGQAPPQREEPKRAWTAWNDPPFKKEWQKWEESVRSGPAVVTEGELRKMRELWKLRKRLAKGDQSFLNGLRILRQTKEDAMTLTDVQRVKLNALARFWGVL